MKTAYDNPCKYVRDKPWIQLFLSMKRDDPLETIKGIIYYYCGMFSGDKFKNIAECDMPNNQDLMHRISKFAEEHFQDKCTLSDLSSHIGYDYSYLSKLFSDKIGVIYRICQYFVLTKPVTSSKHRPSHSQHFRTMRIRKHTQL